MNDAKYIGLDVHQATISVAILDSAGKLVMEAILETKAETILQFICGLRGSLHVTFEEGTCAAWLYELLQPRVTQVVVCDPRKNALLKSGNKNDRNRCSKAGESSAHRFAFPGLSRRAWYSDVAGAGAQLPGDHPGSDAGDDAHKGDLPELGDSLCRPTGVCASSPARMAREAERSRRAPLCRILLSAVRCASRGTSGGPARTACGKP